MYVCCVCVAIHVHAYALITRFLFKLFGAKKIFILNGGLKRWQEQGLEFDSSETVTLAEEGTRDSEYSQY